MLSVWLGAEWKLECIGEIAQLLNDIVYIHIYKYLSFLLFKGIFDLDYLLRSDVPSVTCFDMLTQYLSHTWQQQYVFNTQINLTVAVSDTNIPTYA